MKTFCVILSESQREFLQEIATLIFLRTDCPICSNDAMNLAAMLAASRPDEHGKEGPTFVNDFTHYQMQHGAKKHTEDAMLGGTKH